MVLPTIWALFYKNVSANFAYITVGISAVASAILKFFLNDIPYFAQNMQVMDLVFGIFFPVATLTILTLMHKKA